MMSHSLRLALAAVTLLTTPWVAAADTYELDTTFMLQLPEGLKLGPCPGVTFDSQGRFIASHRGPRPILVYDPQSKLIHMFGDAELTAVHGTRVDADDNIWVTDHKNHTVIKYSAAGQVLMLLGRRDLPGEDEVSFNRPTDVAFAPNGDFFVADGYGNNRVVKFTRDGKYVKAWGTKGTADGEFHLPHCVRFDSTGLLHVADRENDRIQVFDQDGNFVRKFGGFAPFGLFITPNDTLFVADGRAHCCYRMSLDGTVQTRWGEQGAGPGQFNLPHGITVDSEGRVYVAEIDGRRIQRFVNKP